MKSNKGVTLTILIIYIIALLITIGVLTNISRYFYSNTKYISENGKYISEFNKFNMYFIEDVKNNYSIYSIKENEIIFADGTVYTYKSEPDKGIYRNKVKICKNVENCIFTKSEEEVQGVNKITINVAMLLGGSEVFETSTDYILRYW